MIRLSLRLCSSAYRDILLGEKAAVFLDEVSSRLSAARGGVQQLGATAVQTEAASSISISYYEGIRRAAEVLKERAEELRQLDDIIKGTDIEMAKLAAAEREDAEQAADEAAEELVKKIVPKTEIDVMSRCQMEFNAGAGGTEAMLFSSELFDMYRRYADYRGWQWSPIQVDDVESGGIRAAIVSISGPDSYASLRFEAGVHRVQRIPVTDKSRVHTSTASVAVLPEPEEVSVLIPASAVTIETMRASGPGGQNVNKRSSAVRMTHKETGIAVHVMDERYQHLNMQIAYKRLAAILMQKRVDVIHDKFSSDRKLQVGSRARAEKIRTYNFKDDRITDHRLHLHMTNMEEFFRGSDHFHSLVERLSDMYSRERLEDIIRNRILD